jgi:hypothetical protein
MRTAELETILRGELNSAGLGSVLSEERSQFLEMSDGFFAEIVLNDGSSLHMAENLVRRVKDELKHKGVELDAVVRAVWKVKEINFIGPARSVSGGLKGALEFEAVLESGSRECPISVEVSLAALNVLREKLALFDKVGFPGWAEDGDVDTDTLRKMVKEFVALQLSFGGASAWDPVLFPKLQITEQAVVYLLPDSEAYVRLKVAIDDLLVLPDGSPNVMALRSFVRCVRSAGRSIQDYGDQAVLSCFNGLISGGSCAGSGSTRRDAWALYQSLGDPDRKRLKEHHLKRLSQAQKDPMTKPILGETQG